MSRQGDVNEPTREFPEYARGQVTPDPAGSWSDRPTDGDPDESGDPRAGAPRPEPVEAPPARSRSRGLLLLAGVLGLALVLVVGVRATNIWPSWRNPFAQEQTDRSQPPLLKSIQDLSRYVAAEGNFEVVIDLQKDRKYVPEFLLSERTLFVGAGSVESYVDFGQIAEGAIVESEDRKSVEVTLPAPQLGKVNLDLQRSYVFAEKKGMLNQLGELFNDNPDRQREVYLKAEERIAAAAKGSGLTDRAQENTRKMLEGLLRSLGYQTIKVSYTQP